MPTGFASKQGYPIPALGRRPFRRLALGCLPILLTVPASSLHADWQVLRDGQRLETLGAWEERGRTVVFRLPGGTLSSMRLSEIDLEASRRLTALSQRSEQETDREAPRGERQAVWVITDEDVGHASPQLGSQEEGGLGAETEAESEGGLGVETWERQLTTAPEGLEITGTLRNAGDSLAADVSLTVTLRTPYGDPLGSAPAELRRTALPPGESTQFRAVFPGIFDFETVEFQPEAVALEVATGSTVTEPGG